MTDQDQTTDQVVEEQNNQPAEETANAEAQNDTKSPEESISTEEEVEEGESVDNSWRQKIKPGMTVRVYQYIREKDAKGNDKIRQQPFEGIIIAQKGGQQPEATFTVRKIGANGIGVEKIFPLYSPNIAQVKLIKQARVRRAKLFFLRNLKFKKKLKEKNIEE